MWNTSGKESDQEKHRGQGGLLDKGNLRKRNRHEAQDYEGNYSISLG